MRNSLGMDYMALLRLENRLCIAAGEESWLAPELSRWVEAGARVRLFASPEAPFGTQEGVEWIRRPYRSGDLQGAFLALCALPLPQAADFCAEAEEAHVLFYASALTQRSSFILPRRIERSPLLIALSTSGFSEEVEELAASEIAQRIGPEYGEAAAILGELQPLIEAHLPDRTFRTQVLSSLAGDLVEAVHVGVPDHARALARNTISSYDPALQKTWGEERS
ncbi:MAG: hypothetical protein IMW91_06780 [Firmicutes bacterium]|nr:hypothetical protein [Bacillota bacterium]